MYYAIAHLKKMYKIFDITEHATRRSAEIKAEDLTDEYADHPAVQMSVIEADGLVDLVQSQFSHCQYFSIHSMKQAETLGWSHPEIRDAYQAVRITS